MGAAPSKRKTSQSFQRFPLSSGLLSHKPVSPSEWGGSAKCFFGRADGWVSGRSGDQFSVTQKHLTIAQRPGCRGKGVGRNGRDPQVENLASDSVEKTTQNPWFYGMWTARNKVSALSLVGRSVNGITNKKDFQAYLRNERANDNGLKELRVAAATPPPPRQREGARGEPPQKLARCVYGLPRKV